MGKAGKFFGEDVSPSQGGLRDVESLVRIMWSQDGVLSYRDYLDFWQALEGGGARDGGVVVREMITALHEVLEGKRKVRFHLQSILNTLTYVAVMFDMKKEMRLTNALKMWKEKRLDRADPILRLVGKLVDVKADRKSAGLDELLHTILVLSSELHPISRWKKLSDVITYPTLDVNDDLCGQSSPLYFYLHQLAGESPERLTLILRHCVAKLKTIPQQLKLCTRLAQSSLLAFEHILKQLASYWRVPHPAIVNEAVDALQQFYLWPLPYGEVTRNLLTLFKEETMAPGNTVLKRFAFESRVPEVLGYDGKDGQKARPIYYFMDGDSSRSSQVADVMHLGDPEAWRLFNPASASEVEVSAGLSPEITAKLLMNTINYDVPLTHEQKAAVSNLTEEDVYTFFHEAGDALCSVMRDNCGPEKATEIRKQHFTSLRDRLVAQAKLNKQQGAEMLGLDMSDVDVSQLPSLPPVAHLFVKVNHRYAGAEVRPSPVLEPLKEILREFKDLADDEERACIRICVAGGDRMLHSTVSAYVNLIEKFPEAIRGMDLEFFLAPFGPSYMASFLARHDAWFYRHVFVPFQSNKYMLPTCGPRDGPSDPYLSPPGAFLRRCMESYVRETEHLLDVNVYRCEGFLDGNVVEIPFCQFVLLGIDVEAMRHMQARNLPDVKSAMKDKAFTFQPPELKLSITQAGVSGKSRPPLKDEGVSYRSVLVSNVPRPEDTCFPADPTAPWLEMHAQPWDRKKKSTTINDSKHHINECDLTATRGSTFYVLVDQSSGPFMFHGPFNRIRITPIHKPQPAGSSTPPEHLTFPIKTFFPLDM